ncbi:hypothetical protein SUGI_0084740 [Cryptomeria japonica]|nr:hypothetical protein SUGI_0084740 [Cryptomeria japonica]
MTVTGKTCSSTWKKSLNLRVIAMKREKRNLYQILWVSEEASVRDIRSAYRKLAKQFHPDTVLDECLKNISNQQFVDIKEAYYTLVDSQNRAQYDIQLGLRIQAPTSSRGYSCKKQGRSWETDQCW